MLLAVYMRRRGLFVCCSIMNEAEASAVVKLLARLSAAGVAPHDIGVICLYR
jgi:hypothetical protein